MKNSAPVAPTVVIKLGTSVLTAGGTQLARAQMLELVRQCAKLIAMGQKVVIVTSGAIAAGRAHLQHPKLASTIANKQMLAAVGQSKLIQEWENLFAIYGIFIGQMLITRADLDDRERYLNARDMLNALLENNIVPVINENDAVATAEIKVGDNDNLSALVAILANANKLLLLTDQQGLYSADPRSNPDATLLTQISHIDSKLYQIAGGSGTALGTGGMVTKLQAAEIATRAGIEVVIAAGNLPDVITRLASDEAIGTHFLPCETHLESRKRWILAGPAAHGKIVVDDGAANALIAHNGSLLAKGVVQVCGEFARGLVVQLVDTKGKLLARGLTRYSSAELSAIANLHSQEISAKLGYSHGAVVVHRDDLVIIEQGIS